MADKMKVADKMKATKKQKLSKEAIDLVKQFGNALKPALKKAIKTKGLEHAVEFCAVKAPEITKNINQQNKEWTIKRVSLKNRNMGSKKATALAKRLNLSVVLILNQRANFDISKINL
jgi:ribosomal protein L9